MKKIMMVLIMAVLIMGCVGFKPAPFVTTTASVALQLELLKHPEAKAGIIAGLIGVKELLATDINCRLKVVGNYWRYINIKSYIECRLFPS